MNLPQGVKPQKPTKAQFQKMFKCFRESMNKADLYATVSGQAAPGMSASGVGIQPPSSTSPMAINGKKIELTKDDNSFNAEEFVLF